MTNTTVNEVLSQQIAEDQSNVASYRAAVSQAETQVAIDDNNAAKYAYTCSQDESVPSLSADASFECGLEAQAQSVVAADKSRLSYENAGLSDAEQALQEAESALHS